MLPRQTYVTTIVFQRQVSFYASVIKKLSPREVRHFFKTTEVKVAELVLHHGLI